MSKVTGMVSPTQIGFGIRQATEAAAHAARIYVASLQPSQAFLKLDFVNAFNTLSRDAIHTCCYRFARDSEFRESVLYISQALSAYIHTYIMYIYMRHLYGALRRQYTSNQRR